MSRPHALLFDWFSSMTKPSAPNPFGMRCKAAAGRSDPVSMRRTSSNKVMRRERDGRIDAAALTCARQSPTYNDKCMRSGDRDSRSALRWRITIVYTLSCLFSERYPRSFRFRCVNDEEEQFRRMSFMPILINGVVIKSAGPTGRLLGICMFPRGWCHFYYEWRPSLPGFLWGHPLPARGPLTHWQWPDSGANGFRFVSVRARSAPATISTWMNIVHK